MSEASVYQALRGHLATLRLAAAAEALPGVLGAATAEGLGHRRHAILERFASLPAPWRVADFDFDAQPAVDRSLVNELGSLRFLEDATNILFIWASPGPGSGELVRTRGSQRSCPALPSPLQSHLADDDLLVESRPPRRVSSAANQGFYPVAVESMTCKASCVQRVASEGVVNDSARPHRLRKQNQPNRSARAH